MRRSLHEVCETNKQQKGFINRPFFWPSSVLFPSSIILLLLKIMLMIMFRLILMLMLGLMLIIIHIAHVYKVPNAGLRQHRGLNITAQKSSQRSNAAWAAWTLGGENAHFKIPYF